MTYQHKSKKIENFLENLRKLRNLKNVTINTLCNYQIPMIINTYKYLRSIQLLFSELKCNKTTILSKTGVA